MISGFTIATASKSFVTRDWLTWFYCLHLNQSDFWLERDNSPANRVLFAVVWSFQSIYIFYSQVCSIEEGLRGRQNVEGRPMVFFHNINPGARVQVRWRGAIENGTIRYAGSLVAKDGEWVGIELDNRGTVVLVMLRSRFKIVLKESFQIYFIFLVNIIKPKWF